MKYSERFNRDYDFYTYNTDKLDFCGSIVDEVPLGDKTVKQAFFEFDSQGKLSVCEDPLQLKKLIITKKSVNLHIKMWSEGRLEMTLPRCDWEEIIQEFKLPDWAIKASDNQMISTYKKQGLPHVAAYI